MITLQWKATQLRTYVKKKLYLMEGKSKKKKKTHKVIWIGKAEWILEKSVGDGQEQNALYKILKKLIKLN